PYRWTHVGAPARVSACATLWVISETCSVAVEETGSRTGGTVSGLAKASGNGAWLRRRVPVELDPRKPAPRAVPPPSASVPAPMPSRRFRREPRLIPAPAVYSRTRVPLLHRCAPAARRIGGLVGLPPQPRAWPRRGGYAG